MNKQQKKLIIGNWKANPDSQREAARIFLDISKVVKKLKNTEVVITPPLIFLSSLKSNSKNLILGAQDVSIYREGAHTGEVTSAMIADQKVQYVIVGHSERRIDGESDETVGLKVKATLSSLLTPVLCVGEKDRDPAHEYLNVIKKQIEKGLSQVPKSAIGKMVIAYEPVWAIGKDAVREAYPEEFREMKIFIKKVLNDAFGATNSEKIKILYGGSVHPKNVSEFLNIGEADGLLVGRDSLKPEKFNKIIEVCEASKN